MVNSIYNKSCDLSNYIKEKSSQFGSWTTSLFSRYVAKPLENWAIGDLRNMVSSGGQLKEYDQAKGFGYHRFGRLTAVALWRPETREEMATVLNALDAQPYARAPYRFIPTLVGAPDFLLADTSPSALAHRKELIPFFSKPREFVSIAWDLWNQGIREPNEVAMQTVAKGLLGIELSEEEIRMFSQLGITFKSYAKIPLPANLLKFLPQRGDASRYQLSIEALLKREIQKQKDFPEQELKGALAEAIREKIEKPNLHLDSDLKALVLLFLAVDNVFEVLQEMNSLIYYNNMSDYIPKLAQELETSGVVKDTKIDPSTLLDREKMPVLETVYQELLKRSNLSSVPAVVRYAQHGIQCGEHVVPPGTYLAIEPPKNVEKASLGVFSAGARLCPGRLVAEAIIKTLIVASFPELQKRFPKIQEERKVQSLLSRIREDVKDLRDEEQCLRIMIEHLEDCSLSVREIVLERLPQCYGDLKWDLLIQRCHRKLRTLLHLPFVLEKNSKDLIQ